MIKLSDEQSLVLSKILESDSDCIEGVLRDAGLKIKSTNSTKISDVIDLSNSDLESLNLSCANLNNASLMGAVLESSDLSKANLKGANLNDAVLINACLNYAKMKRSNLQGANLRNASMRGADLRNVFFGKVNLSGVTLDDANLKGSNLEKSVISGMTDEKLSAKAMTKLAKMTEMNGGDPFLSFHIFIKQKTGMISINLLF